jgi:putative ABC transport system ATP-binding protein
MRLQLDQISKTYRSGSHRVQAVDRVSLSLDAGQFAAVQGPSGCGKTTLLLIAGGLLAPDQGTVTIEGQNPYALDADARAAFRSHNVGFVFQQFHLVPYLTVYENVLTAGLATTRAGSQERARQLLAQFGLEARADHVPSQLSTGERQRTALARAVLNDPKLLLADEPTGNLDAENAEIVLRHLREFADAGGSVLLVTHDSRAVSYAQQVIQLHGGRIAVPA